MGQELTRCVKYAQLDPQFMDSLYSVIMECHNIITKILVSKLDAKQ